MRGPLLLLALAAIAFGRFIDNDRVKRNTLESHDWLTEEQKSEIEELKKTGSLEDVKKRVMQLYDTLSGEVKEEWDEKYKKMCVAWLKDVASEEELEEMKKLKEAGEGKTLKGKYDAMKERLGGDSRKMVDLWDEECTTLWKGELKNLSRKRRDLNDLIEKHLAFLSDEQKNELKKMKTDGKSDDEIKSKVATFTVEHFKKEGKIKSDEDFINGCYAWIKDVTSAEEYAAFEKLHHTDHEACRKKVHEFVERLAEGKRENVKKSLPLCDAVWYNQHQKEHGGHDHHAHHHHKRHVHHVKRHLNSMHIDQYLHWMTEDQKAEVKKVEEANESYEKVVEKVKEFYKVLPEDKQKEVKEDFKTRCSAWVKQVSTPEEMAELKALAEAGTQEELKAKLKLKYDQLDEDTKHEVDHIKDICFVTWTKKDRRRRGHPLSMDEVIEKYLPWLSEEETAEVKGMDEGDKSKITEKVLDFYKKTEGTRKEEATEKLKEGCRHFIKTLIGDEKAMEMKKLHETGATAQAMAERLDEIIEGIEVEEKKKKAKEVAATCKNIYGVSRKRRDHSKDMETFLDWLSENEKKEVETLKEDKEKYYGKIMEFWSKAEGETKTVATEKLKGACRAHFAQLFGEEKTKEIKEMRESGRMAEDIGRRVETFIEEIEDEKKREGAKKAVNECKKVYGIPSRKRREHHEYSVDEIVEKFLSWMSDEEKAEIKGMDAGDKMKISEKVLEIYAKTEGKKKEEAAEQLKHGCRHFIKNIIGDEKSEEMKKMKESGATAKEMAGKLDELIGGLEDETKKAKAQKLSATCRKIYGVSRKRRDQHVEEYLTSWLNEDQKKEVAELMKSENKDGLYGKIAEFYETTDGDKKKEAAEKLQQGCRHYFKTVFGEEKAQEMKKLKEGGASIEDLTKKVEGFLAEMPAGDKKTRATKAIAGCKKVFAASRRRRSEHKHTLEEAYTNYLTWLSDDQRMELKNMEEAGAQDKIQDKVLEYFGDLKGEEKEGAKDKLKLACRHYMKHALGEAKSNTLKELAESGATHSELAKKTDEIIEGLEDEAQKTKAQRINVNCKKVYGLPARARRDQNTGTEKYKQFFTWLTEEQRKEVKGLMEKGDDEAAYEKVTKFYEAVDASKKAEVTELMRGACRERLRETFGAEKADELKKMKESGADQMELVKKVEGLVDGMADGKEKEKAKKGMGACARFFIEKPSRLRRDQKHEEYIAKYKQYFTWLSEEQRAEIKELFTKKEDDAAIEKILSFYEKVDASKKGEVKEQMKGACRERIRETFGGDKAEELKKMKESGVDKDEIIKKVEGLVDGMTDATAKEKAKKGLGACARFFFDDKASRLRRDEHKHREGYAARYKHFFTWLTEEQRTEIKELMEKGEDEKANEKIVAFYEKVDASKKEEVKEQMRGACRERLKDTFGAEKAEELKKMKEAGTDKMELVKKVESLVDAMEDEVAKKKAKSGVGACAQFFVEARKRRQSEGVERFFTWMTEEQKKELQEYRNEPEKMYAKVFEFHEGLEGRAKAEATMHLRGACRFFVKQAVGDEQAEKLRIMKEAGASKEKLEETVDGMIEFIENPKKKIRARNAIEQCKKVW